MIQPGLALMIISVLLLSLPCCGKKGDPFLPQKGFDARVTDLKADAQESFILLEGDVLLAENGGNRVTGCRVYIAQYPSESPPCEGCPIEYQSYQSFGPEVFQGKRFSCRIPDIRRNQIYFFKVVLLGAGDIQGSASDFVLVNLE